MERRRQFNLFNECSKFVWLSTYKYIFGEIFQPQCRCESQVEFVVYDGIQAKIFYICLSKIPTGS